MQQYNQPRQQQHVMQHQDVFSLGQIGGSSGQDVSMLDYVCGVMPFASMQRDNNQFVERQADAQKQGQRQGQGLQ